MEENVSEENVVVIRESAPMINDEIVDIANNAERRIAAINKIKSIVFKVTNNNDWIDQQGNPYLQASGCQKVANVFGINWKFITEPKKIYEEDGNYRYDVTLEVYTKNRIIEVVGIRSTKDPFFSKSHGETKPVSEIDSGDILKAAITNGIANGITAILGIKNMTWAELEAAGIYKDKALKVEYGKKEMAPENTNLRAEIENMLMSMAEGSKVESAKILMEATSFIGTDGKEVRGKSTISDLTEKAIPVVYGKVKDKYETWKKEHSNDGQQNKSEPAGNGKPTEQTTLM